MIDCPNGTVGKDYFSSAWVGWELELNGRLTPIHTMNNPRHRDSLYAENLINSMPSVVKRLTAMMSLMAARWIIRTPFF